jgi:hypothetical protein
LKHGWLLGLFLALASTLVLATTLTTTGATGAVGGEVGIHEAMVFGGFAAALRASPGVGRHGFDEGGKGDLEILEVDKW